MGHDLTYQWTRPEDVHSVSTLFNIVSPQYARTDIYWHWSNTESPCGPSLSVVAKAGDQIIAHYSFMPLDFFIKGQIRTIGFGLQAVVQKEFRNFKTMKGLTDMIFESARGKFPISYAFPNEEFFLVKTRLLGWQSVGSFSADVIRVNDVLSPGDSGCTIRPLPRFPDLKWFSQSPDAAIAPRKNAALLNWRFIQHPVNHYFILGAYRGDACVGYLVLKTYFKKDDNALVGHFVDYDSEGKDSSVLRSLTRAGAEFLKFYGIEKIIFWNREIHFKNFFQPMVSGQSFKTSMGVLIGDKNFETLAVNPENWSFTMAISDAF